MHEKESMLKGIKSRYSLATIDSSKYCTVTINSGSTDIKVLTDEELKAGEQGYVFAPYIPIFSTPIMEVPDWLLRQFKREALKKKIQKVRNA